LVQQHHVLAGLPLPLLRLLLLRLLLLLRWLLRYRLPVLLHALVFWRLARARRCLLSVLSGSYDGIAAVLTQSPQQAFPCHQVTDAELGSVPAPPLRAAAQAAACQPSGSPCRRLADRKSTRLNSSHT